MASVMRGSFYRGREVRVIPCSSVPDGAYVVDASYMGAPTVSIEKLDSNQAEAAAAAVLKAGVIAELFRVQLN